ncbi:MAG: MoxR family ATPase [Saccharopolyspora sp.]|uniref:AAA family ATPase n=1 Tax=Saccharopolyspora sp. TaxID=33915 RepID=UPI0025D2A853|nr:MoxR family ATPase [Saccharopolyspora sp.]MBQ6644239.1 MoxR family ATPase [Saccharopolyspora sp.]
MNPTPSYEFDSVEHTISRLAEVGYLADRRLATTVYLLTRLIKPVLLEGPAGVGKTELAHALADSTGRRVVRLQCYEGQDESRALYEWDYGKQMLYTQMLREKIGDIVESSTGIAEAVEQIGSHDDVFFSERFLSSRPLLEAIRSEAPVVLLVDEIDRADEALEAVLLEVLAEGQISIPEIGTFVARHAPYVVLTSNNTRDLSAALKRRCLHLFLDYPDADRELQIIQSKGTGLGDAVAEHLVQVVRGLRELDLRKPPSISEAIDWARTLAVLGISELGTAELDETLSVVLKYDKDLARAREQLAALVQGEIPEPASVPAQVDAATEHAPADREGRTVRSAKDQPGRHGPGTYGERSQPAVDGQPARPRVSTGQGERSFTSKFRRRG